MKRDKQTHTVHVPTDPKDRVSLRMLIEDALTAEDRWPVDELERYAKDWRERLDKSAGVN